MEYWSFGILNLFKYSSYNIFTYLWRKLCIILCRIISFKLISLNISALKINRNINPYWTRSACCCQMPCLFKCITDILRVFYHSCILCHIRHRLNYIVFWHGSAR